MVLESRALKTARRYGLILVDLSVGFTDPVRSQLGVDCPAVVAANQRLLASFRARGAPVFYTTVAYDDAAQASVFREKLPALNALVAGSALVAIDARLAPAPGEVVIVKRGASGFFGTDLGARLHEAGVDGVVVGGLTTSGCVRATAVDGLQNDFRVVIPAEAVGDRNPQAHQARRRNSRWRSYWSKQSWMICARE